ncbi:MAG: DinB family protein [Planctomycetota bacterium]
MTPDEARLLVDYHLWARERALAAVAALTPEQFTRDLKNSFGSVRDTLAHLYGADAIWLERWRGGSPRGLPPAARFPDLASLRAAWAEFDPQLHAFVAGLGAEGLAKQLTYTAFNGQQATLPYWQMLQHVVNHGSYHRGQVTTLLRQLGAPAPQGMDLVAFYRERGGA